MKLLVITSEWPTPDNPASGSFVALQVEKLRSIGLDVDVFTFRGSMKPQRYLKAWVSVRQKINETQYDLIHAHFGQSGILALPKQIPLVVTFHGSDLNGVAAIRGRTNKMAGILLRTISHFVGLVADEVIVVSPRLRQRISRKDAHLVPCGLDLDLFVPIDMDMARRELNLPLNQKFILFGGSPTNPIKQYWLAQQAVSLVNQSHAEPIDLVTIKNEPHERVPLYMNACDLLLLTSVSEGSPMVIKEALACNVPIVSLDVGDVKERISDVNGCIVCLDDKPETIALSITSVLRQGKRISGAEAVRSLDERRLAVKIQKIYQKAIHR